jgi:hypothetical protein
VLCCAVLCCAVLCCTVLCCITLCCAVLCCVLMLCCTVLPCPDLGFVPAGLPLPSGQPALAGLAPTPPLEPAPPLPAGTATGACHTAARAARLQCCAPRRAMPPSQAPPSLTHVSSWTPWSATWSHTPACCRCPTHCPQLGWQAAHAPCPQLLCGEVLASLAGRAPCELPGNRTAAMRRCPYTRRQVWQGLCSLPACLCVVLVGQSSHQSRVCKGGNSWPAPPAFAPLHCTGCLMSCLAPPCRPPTLAELRRLAEAALPFVERAATQRAGGAPARARTLALCGEGTRVAYSMVGPGSHYCENVGRPHASNHVFFVLDFAAGIYAQKCHDPDCSRFRSAWMPLAPELCLLEAAGAAGATAGRGQMLRSPQALEASSSGRGSG